MEAARNICAEYGDNAIGETKARKQFSRFKEDRFETSGTPCPLVVKNVLCDPDLISSPDRSWLCKGRAA